jgi:hypothetical protein
MVDLKWVFLYLRNKVFSAPTDDEIRKAADELRADPAIERVGGGGMCLIVFPGGRPDICLNNMQDGACQTLAGKYGGRARPVVPGTVCPD